VLVRFRPVLGEDLDRALVAAELERASLWERVLLVGSAPTLSAAQACNVAAREMEQLLGREDLDQRHWDDAVVKFKDARRDFHQAARIDMGVVGAPPKDMSWTWSSDRSRTPTAWRVPVQCPICRSTRGNTSIQRPSLPRPHPVRRK